MTLRHSGYTHERSAAKDKRSRNLRLAELDTAAGDDHAATVNLARSQMWVGGTEDAIATCRAGLAATDQPTARMLLLSVLAEALTAVGDHTGAEEALAQLRAVSTSPVTADELEARLRFVQGDYARALELLRAFPESALDDTSTVVSRSRLAGLEIRSLAGVGDAAAAAELLRRHLRDGALPLDVAQMAPILAADGGDIRDVAGLVPRTGLHPLLIEAAQAPDDLADPLLDALWARYPGDAGILAVAARLGPRLPIVRALEWSVRLRRHGLADHCCLVALARDPARSPRDRSLAGAVALEMFGAAEAMAPLSEALALVPDADSETILGEMRLLAPGVAAGVEPVG